MLMDTYIIQSFWAGITHLSVTPVCYCNDCHYNSSQRLRSQSSSSVAHPFDTMIGNICFYLTLLVWTGELDIVCQHYMEESVDSSSQYWITNKVKDVSYKLLHLVKLYLQKMFSDIDSSCFFCGVEVDLSLISSGNAHIQVFFFLIFVLTFSSEFFCYSKMFY